MTTPRIRVLLMAGSMEGGGSERQTLLLLQHLDRRRFAPELFLSFRRGPLLEHLPDDVPVHAQDRRRSPQRWNWPGRLHRRNVADLAALLRERRIDVVYDRTFHMTLLAGPACRRTGVPHVSTIVTPDRFLPQLDRRFWRIKRRLLGRAYRDAYRVLAVSDAIAAGARTVYRLPADRVVTVRNPVDLAALAHATTIKSPLPIDARRFNVACVGRMSAEKGHAVLLDAARRLLDDSGRQADHWRFWLIGDGPLREQLQQHARRLRIERYVHFAGYQPRAVAALAACQALVLPSLFEGMPNVMLEAFAVGTPVVATAVEGAEELADGGARALLVPPGDAASLAAALSQVHDAPQAAARRAEAARQAVQQQYDAQRIVPQIEAWLEQAAHAGTPPQPDP